MCCPTTELFEWSGEECAVTVRHTVSIPDYTSDWDELALRVLRANSAPRYLLHQVRAALASFVLAKNGQWADRAAGERLRQLQDQEADRLVDRLATLYEREVLEFAAPIHASSEDTYADIFNQVIHSAGLETVVQLEQRGCAQLSALADARDHQLLQLQQRHATQLQQATADGCEAAINATTGRLVEETLVAESQWQSRIEAVKDEQRSRFWHWVSLVHERLQTGVSPPALDDPPPTVPPTVPPRGSVGEASGGGGGAPSFEESFTVHLGAQLKHMYNLRLVAADILHLLRYPDCAASDQVQPCRVQTLVDLYSRSLSAAVLLVDDRLTSYTGLRRRFAALADRSAELHFAPLQQQLAGVRATLATSATHAATERPAAGDVYVTRHSNLAAAHVVLHVVTAAGERDACGDTIGSRHATVLALRNVARLALQQGVATLHVPLLLSHSFEPHMTVAWCLRRAELVFKCVKGFLMEMASWISDGSGATGGDGGQGADEARGAGRSGGSSVKQRTVQFVLPRDVPEEVFVSLSDMIPTIFRLANPLVVSAQH